MISKGDVNRSATACDCSSTVTAARAATLYNNGYRIVGRYLTGGWKEIQPGEIETIFDAGLRIFSIYQTSGDSASYFDYAQGKYDAREAIVAAKHYGFKSNSIIYFSVDFDALDYDVSNNILPYFEGIVDQFTVMQSNYRIGVYGPRNICTRVGENGYSCSSFVADMSTGFSGNLGYPLPIDWNFDQILEYSIGSGSGYINIDKDICRGRYLGEDSVDAPVNIIDIANNSDLANLFGVDFELLDTEMVFIDQPNFRVSGSVSLSATSNEEGITFKFKDGKFEGVESEYENIISAFGFTLAEFGAKISGLDWVEFWTTVEPTDEGFKINLVNEYSISGLGFLEVVFSIEFKKVTLDTVLETVDSVVNYVTDIAQEQPIIFALCIAGLAILIYIGSVPLEISAVISGIFEGLTAIIVFIISLINRLLPLLSS